MQRVLAELYADSIEGVVVAGVPKEDGSGNFDLDDVFTVRCDDGALFKAHGWMTDVTVLSEENEAAIMAADVMHATSEKVESMDRAKNTDSVVVLESLARLLDIARRDTGQSRRVADFLLAWHDAEENGGWNPVDLWQVDASISEDMLLVLKFLRHEHKYLDELGFAREVDEVWRRWRGKTV